MRYCMLWQAAQGRRALHRRTRDVSDVRHGGTTSVVRLSCFNNGTSPIRLSGSRTTEMRDMIDRLIKEGMPARASRGTSTIPESICSRKVLTYQCCSI